MVPPSKLCGDLRDRRDRTRLHSTLCRWSEDWPANLARIVSTPPAQNEALLRPRVDGNTTSELADQSPNHRASSSKFSGDPIAVARRSLLEYRPWKIRLSAFASVHMRSDMSVDKSIKKGSPIEPLYTPLTCCPAYQLRWSLALFPNSSVPPTETWEADLNEALSADGIRVLETTTSGNGALMFLLSTQPNLRPTTITQRVKGRLQYLLRTKSPTSWRRNFRLSTLNAGAVRRRLSLIRREKGCLILRRSTDADY